MTIDEKIKNAEALFRNYYLANGKEDIKIGGRILEENGFGKDFWAVICPVLQKKGVLKSYRYEIITLDTLELYKNYVNPRDVQHLDARINHMERELEWQYTRQGISPFSEGERVEKIRDIKKQLEELKNERNTAERVHSFKINAAYFKNETNHFPENSAAEKVRAAGDKSFNFENEKRGISAIESADEYKIVTDKWINIKHILDALYKLLSPIDTEAVQVVSLRANFLPYEQNLLFKSVIFDMFKVGVIGDPSRTMRPVVINSNLASKVLTGEYIPIKVVAFKAYRKQVSDLAVWIETNRARFIKANEDTLPKAENEQQLSGVVMDDSAPRDEDEEDDCFSYDGGPSAPYPNTDLELFVLKKILLQHKQRGDGGFNAKELSFNNDSLADICRPIQLMIEDKILYLSANTFPERSSDDKDDGIEDKRGFINWKLVEQFDKNSSEIDAVVGGVNFDIDMQDEVKLKGRLDIAIEEFMNDKIQNPDGFAYGMDKSKLSEALARNEKETDKQKKKWIDEIFGIDGSSYPYAKQREIIIGELAKGNGGETVMSLNGFRDPGVDVLKTLLALEKENVLRIKELQSNAIFDKDGNFIGFWATKDNPSAKIQIINMPANGAKKLMKKVGRDTSLASQEKSTVGEPPYTTQPSFDEMKSRIIWNGQYCEIPVNKNSHFFCKKMFDGDFGDKVPEDEISGLDDRWDDESPRSVYFAMQWVNEKIRNRYHIEENLFTSQNSYFWIRDELFNAQ